jgi:hypothetical protein
VQREQQGNRRMRRGLNGSAHIEVSRRICSRGSLRQERAHTTWEVGMQVVTEMKVAPAFGISAYAMSLGC